MSNKDDKKLIWTGKELCSTEIRKWYDKQFLDADEVKRIIEDKCIELGYICLKLSKRNQDKIDNWVKELKVELKLK